MILKWRLLGQRSPPKAKTSCEFLFLRIVESPKVAFHRTCVQILRTYIEQSPHCWSQDCFQGFVISSIANRIYLIQSFSVDLPLQIHQTTEAELMEQNPSQSIFATIGELFSYMPRRCQWPFHIFLLIFFLVEFQCDAKITYFVGKALYCIKYSVSFAW